MQNIRREYPANRSSLTPIEKHVISEASVRVNGKLYLVKEDAVKAANEFYGNLGKSGLVFTEKFIEKFATKHGFQIFDLSEAQKQIQNPWIDANKKRHLVEITKEYKRQNAIMTIINGVLIKNDNGEIIAFNSSKIRQNWNKLADDDKKRIKHLFGGNFDLLQKAIDDPVNNPIFKRAFNFATDIAENKAAAHQAEAMTPQVQPVTTGWDFSLANIKAKTTSLLNKATDAWNPQGIFASMREKTLNLIPHVFKDYSR